MDVPMTTRPFAWDCLEDSPSLDTVRRFLRLVPDGRLLESLRRHRGWGRDDYSVSSQWGVLLRHTSIEACLQELHRNEGLRRLIGIKGEQKVPKAWNMSRFLQVLGGRPHRELLKVIFDGLVRGLAQGVEDLGSQTAGDATALCARAGRGKQEDGLAPPSGGAQGV